MTTTLLAEYHRRHDARDWAGLAALFAEDGEIAFHGLPVPSARGPAAIERLFTERGPDDALVLGPVLPQAGGALSAVYGWRAAPARIAGTIWLRPSGDRIARLDVFARAGGPAEPRDRAAARAVVLAPGPLVLLIRCREPATGASWWITPGGGVDPGEDELVGLRRELAEEIGLSAFAPGPVLWTRTHTFLWEDLVLRQRERFWLVEVPAPFDVAPQLAPELLAHEGHAEWRWFPADALPADEIYAPRAFPDLLRRLLRDGPPAVPIDAGL